MTRATLSDKSALRDIDAASLQVSLVPTESGCKSLLLGIGTAVPSHTASQDQTLAFALAVAKATDSSIPAALIKRIYTHSGIATRHSVLDDYLKTDPADFEFFPKTWALYPAPGTAARMDAYEEHALDLALVAARNAIRNAGIAAASITHVVISTCTGFFAPGLDVLLLRQLGIPTSAQRTVLGFMGCYAGISGLRTCQQIASSNPQSVVLQIAVELCSLHYQTTPTIETIVSNAIFSDGAAAAIHAGVNAPVLYDSECSHPSAEVIAAHSDISPDSLDRMSWRIGDSGFIMTLDSGVPEILKGHAPAFTAHLAASAGLTPADIDGWAIHPGGRKIIEALRDCLDLTDDDVASSNSTLYNYGNMSSGTVLFVLAEELQRRSRGDYIATMAFGPGLTMEGALLRRI